MDILMVSDVYFPRINGVSTSIRTFAKALVALGHRVVLVAPDYGSAMREEQAARDTEFGPSFEVIRLPARTIFFDPEDRLVKASAMRDAYERLAQRRWGVVHVHTPFRAHTLGVRIGRACNARVVETYHTYFEEYVAHYLPWCPPRITRFLARHLSRKLCGEVDRLIVPSEEMAGVLKRYGIDTPATVLPTGIDLGEFDGGDRAAFRTRHGLKDVQPVVATVSRLAVEKNIAFLIDVVQRLVPDFPALRFVVAGEGPDAPRLRRLVRERNLDAHVLFLGNLDRRTTLLDCYRGADAFLFASPTETQGLVLIEAMALGVPIVSTAVMGTATVLRDAQSAVVAPDDLEGFTAAVARVLRDGALRARLSAAGPRDAQAWSNDALMQRVLTVYGAPGDAQRVSRPAEEPA
jgi:glycosyltransferase involved in cell wall biosynthesis